MMSHVRRLNWMWADGTPYQYPDWHKWGFNDPQTIEDCARLKPCKRWGMVWENMCCTICLHLRKRYIINCHFYNIAYQLLFSIFLFLSRIQYYKYTTFHDDITSNNRFNNKHNNSKSSVNIYSGEKLRRYYHGHKSR